MSTWLPDDALVGCTVVVVPALGPSLFTVMSSSSGAGVGGNKTRVWYGERERWERPGKLPGLLLRSLVEGIADEMQRYS